MWRPRLTSGDRAGRRPRGSGIRGPHSALTDFLAVSTGPAAIRIMELQKLPIHHICGFELQFTSPGSAAVTTNELHEKAADPNYRPTTSQLKRFAIRTVIECNEPNRMPQLPPRMARDLQMPTRMFKKTYRPNRLPWPPSGPGSASATKMRPLQR